MTRNNRLLEILIILILGGLLAGCASLPRSGVVTESQQHTAHSPSLIQSAFGPVPGASRLQIVTDFLRASAAGPNDDYAVAREYLTGQADKDWDPTERVTVVNAGDITALSINNNGQVVLRAPIAATINRQGVYTVPAGSGNLETTFRLMKVAGQWRISGLEPGVIFTDVNLPTVFAPVSVYFLSHDQKVLVADPRWLPRNKLATHLVQSLLAGPSENLDPAVISAFNSTITLPLKSLEIEQGIAKVNLGSAEGLVSGPQGKQMWRQLMRTLGVLPEVTGVQITVNGSPLQISDVPTEEVVVTKRAVVENGEINLRDSSGVELIASKSELAGKSPRAAALSPTDDSQLAFIDDSSHLYALQKNRPPRMLLSASDITNPSIDRLGWIWVAQATGGQIYAVHPDGKIASVQSSWPKGKVCCIKVSRDGTRVLALIEVGKKRSLHTAIIERNPSGIPLRLVNPQHYPLAEDSLISASWVSVDSMVAVQRDPKTDNTTVVVVPVGGPVTRLEGIANTVSISGGAAADSLVLVTANGTVFERSGSVWRQIGSRVRSYVFAG